MTAGQLAQRLNLTTGAVTNVIDRLEKQHFAKREPDPKDRRKVIVALLILDLQLNRSDLHKTRCSSLYSALRPAGYGKFLSAFLISSSSFLIKSSLYVLTKAG
ncbi:MarR family winged helix-turn-helix transcriptional regulator [Gordoniibacillus kamchatkensis]|uniref:MarR family winged helix-turn-helix transcriptional regulator n=1 Tax=Gordoniibacillus kamchatkensis TaxID=1590651 RepID=UPI001E386407|nr:MarR family transcriptional regulator [Paenibacillus sp. VKM B-2647]